MVRRATVQYEGATVRDDGPKVEVGPSHCTSHSRTSLRRTAREDVSASLELDVCLSEQPSLEEL